QGWATFISTPRGRNHCWELYKHAGHSAGRFSELLTASDTKALTREALAEALSEYQALYGLDAGNAAYQQEYFCSFTASILGAFYALECRDVHEQGRTLEVEPMPGQLVHKAWDLGVGDDTSIWWFAPQP